MDIKKKKLAGIVPAAVLAGAAVFGIGYFMRPGPMTATTPAPSTIQTSTFTTKGFAKLAPPEIEADVAPDAAVLVAQEGSAASSDSASQNGTQVREGTIVSMNGELFILRDDENNTWYHLDDQHAAGSFLGKKVQVKGPVDPATDVIHVESIEQAKA